MVQAVAIGLFVLPWANEPGVFRVGASVLMGIAIVLTVVTGVDYVIGAIREVRAVPAEKTD
ncbi:CDP-diacylglycerol--glycerol-3-phosphate 3-phosphatidyltransferase [Mycobacterium tuberculosis]|nr:CDP-diacylglycerol--glycerol-3-phosphate 3-phosphatidyltransferase [Mycobacterium tuberculosis]